MAILKRSSGLLLHPTSLPGGFGIGELNSLAYRWVDFLVDAKQSIWQILPLAPTGYGNSPYSTASVFAGNPLLLDLKRIAHEGFIDFSALENAPNFTFDHVDFEAVINWKMPLLLDSYHQFREKATPEAQDSFRKFCQNHNGIWLNDFATFMAFKNHFDGKAWNEWPTPLRRFNPRAVKNMQAELARQIDAHKYLQYQFFKQWMELKAYTNERGVQIMGDIPIYTNFDCAEVWANQDIFLLDDDGNPTEVAGVPPDYFSPTGQLWGNPIYDWKSLKNSGFRWWIERVRMILETVDIVRIDHFRGFESFWAVPFGAKTAEHGEWRKGPGNAFFDALIKALGKIPIVVEDLGFITEAVGKLRDDYHFPGMKILQFAFGGDPNEPFLPHNYERNCIVYTGSHDNDTTLGWFKNAPEYEQKNCVKYIGGLRDDISWEMIRLASASTAVMAIFPVQDVLSLDESARMNTPGKAAGNWSWRLLPDQLGNHHAQKLAALSETYGRVPAGESKDE